MKKIILLLLLSISSLNAVHIGTAKHLPDGLKIINYLTYSSADKMKNNDGDTSMDDLGVSISQYIFRPVYYSENFVYQLIIPYKNQKADFLNEKSNGVGDTTVGVGYFVPTNLEKTDLGFLINVKLPTGHFDKNKTLNEGSGYYSSSLEFYMNKILGNIMWDSSLKYYHHFKNSDNNKKEGEEFTVESSFGYFATPKFSIGPSITYIKGRDDYINGVKQTNSGHSRFNIALEGFYVLNKDLSFLLAVSKDYKVQNNFETKTVLTRIMYSF